MHYSVCYAFSFQCVIFCFLDKSATSDSSGVCTSNSATSYESGHERFFDPFLPGNRCICVADYSSPIPGHLQLSSGDIVEGMFMKISAFFIIHSVDPFIV